MQRSIRVRILTIFIILAVAPLLAVGVFLAWQGFTTQQENAVLAQQDAATTLSTQVGAFLSSLDSQLNVLIQTRGLQDLSFDQQQSVLQDLLSYQYNFEQLALLDGSGKEQARVSRLTVVGKSDLVSRPQSVEFTSPISTGKTYYSPVKINTATGEPFMTIAVPIPDLRSGLPIGVLVAEVRFKPVWDLVASFNPSHNTIAYILDADKRVVAHPDPSVVLKGTHFDLPTAPNGIVMGLSGTSTILGTNAVQFGDQRLIVIVEQPATGALALAINTVVITAIVILAALILAAGIGVATIRRLVRPIQSLASTAEAIMAGDLASQANVVGDDEIGRMAKAFNSMTAQLRQTLEGLQQNVSDLEKTRIELEVANIALRESEASLEKRVTDRTRDLQIAADVSRQITTILDLNELLQVVVERTKAAFNLYHTSIFLRRAESNGLMLQAGAGKVGEAMKGEGWYFDLNDQGLVPEAARRCATIVINDTTTEARFRPNQYLPETRSEVALPMFVGDRLVGVLDLQSEQLNRFSADDIRVMTTLAEQIAIAVNNADLYAEQVRVAEELRSVDKMKSQFLASMSHELRTPLNAILNFTEFVAVGMLGPVTDAQVDALNKALDSGNHLLALINDVLDMTKIEAGSMKLFIEQNIDLYAELESVIATAQSLLNGRSVTFVEDIDKDFPRISGDRRRIRQILLNLISNAVKFTEEGTITLRAKHQGHEVLFAVIDTGPGIAFEDQERIFEPFVQTETGIAHAGGTGLGLPISRRLTEAHGGRLWLESKPGAGAAFYVTLPLNAQDSSIPPQDVREGTYAK